MVLCGNCGFDMVEGSDKICPKCAFQTSPNSENPEIDNVSEQSAIISTSRSKWWYLLPIFVSIIGGTIAYFVLKKSDPKLAKKCLIVGLIMMAIGVITNFAVMA
jgi:hypothetical protein